MGCTMILGRPSKISLFRLTQAFFFNGCGAPLSSRRLPPCWVLRENPEFFPIFWVYWQRSEFFPLYSLNKSCPNFEFWAKNGLEFFQMWQKLSQNVEKNPGINATSGYCMHWIAHIVHAIHYIIIVNEYRTFEIEEIPSLLYFVTDKALCFV